MPHYLGFSDACKCGGGGVWMGGLDCLRPVVWRLGFPDDIVQLFASNIININDCKMAALTLGYMLLGYLVPIKHKHSAEYCDNSTTVSWASRMAAKHSPIGMEFSRALALRYCSTQSSPLAPMALAGKHNRMADLANRSFHAGGAGNYNLDDFEFLTKFNLDFPLTQESSWLLLRPSNKLKSLVFAVLRGEQLGAESWLRLPKFGFDIGHIGKSSPDSVAWTPFSATAARALALTTSNVSLIGSEKGMQEEDIRSGLAQFRRRFAPSARRSNWMDTRTHSSSRAPTAPTTKVSSNSSKATGEKTPNPPPN